MPELRCIVLANKALCIDARTELDEFWTDLGDVLGWVRFERVTGSEGTFRAVERRPARDPAPSPSVSAQGVWWRRQAAIEAERGIAAYRAEADPFVGSDPQSAT